MIRIALFISIIFGSQNILCQENETTLQFNGSLKTNDKNNKEIIECIATSPFIVGIESYSESNHINSNGAFAKGSYSYSYYVDNQDTFAGEIEFKFEFIIIEKKFYYSFFDFKHLKSGSNFESIGILSNTWSNKAKKSFNKEQYSRIMYDLNININHFIKMINKYCAH